MDRPFVGVGALVISGGCLLMVKRGRDPGAGRWSLPGGRVEPGEALTDAVAREIQEETGLTVEVGGLAGVFEWIGEEHLVVLDYYASAPGRPEPTAASDAAEARWVPLDQVAGLDTSPRLAETLRSWGVLPA